MSGADYRYLIPGASGAFEYRVIERHIMLISLHSQYDQRQHATMYRTGKAIRVGPGAQAETG